MANPPSNNELQFARLRALATYQPRTRIAQIRSIWPLIKTALERGHNLTTVCEGLHVDGLDIPYRTLSRYVNRLRFEEAMSNAPLARPETTRPSGSLMNEHSTAHGAVSASRPNTSGELPGTQRSGERDPMAIARNYLSGGKKVRGFQFKEGVPDLSKLV